MSKKEAPLAAYRDALEALAQAEAAATKCEEECLVAQKAHADALAKVAKAKQVAESAHAVLCAAIATGDA